MWNNCRYVHNSNVIAGKKETYFVKVFCPIFYLEILLKASCQGRIRKIIYTIIILLLS